MKDKPNLVSGQVLLRPCRPDDAADLYAAARESIAEVYPWMPWCHPDYSIEESRTWLAQQCEERSQESTEYSFAITDSGDGSFLGGCGMRYINQVDRVVNLGYWVRTSRTRQGIATTATRLLARFGLEELKLNRIEIFASIDNKASQRVAEKAGATREGILRNRLVVRELSPDNMVYRERVSDAVMFSLIPQDLTKLLD
ncbi:MAG: GNAT family N-acetyltransferase [Dehalococcoidales bacterium]|nr:MAG: GNAT family N-acetyltransferase [Dehalococcoidales bacterium]